MSPTREGGGRPLSPLWLMPLLAFLAMIPIAHNQELISSPYSSTFSDDLGVQNLMVELRKHRGRRALNKRNSEDASIDSPESEGGVVVAKNASGRCVLSADRASHFCGLDAEGESISIDYCNYLL
ncbi:hypothetical protein PFISCL1PPCAC_10306, partial [Pristionchus fissidentatus]